MARLTHSAPTGYRVGVVDDDENLRTGLARLLEREGHAVRQGANGADALALVREWDPHLLLLDYYMPGGTGADIVRDMRAFNDHTQVILVTGYAAEQPARRLLRELDIQGYHDKADGPERLLVLIDAALKHSTVLDGLLRKRRYLKHILDVLPDITRLRPPEELFQVALDHVGPLLEGRDGFIATSNNGLFVLDGAGEGISIRAGTGRFARVGSLGELPSELADVVHDALGHPEPRDYPNGCVAIPLTTREGHRGCMVVEARGLPSESVEACAIYANQVVQALENIALFERATVDLLTGTANRAFGMARLADTLRLGERTGTSTSLLMLDLDQLKALNDTRGHAAGDLLLRALGRTLRETLRTSDIVARYGGDEFFAVMPATGAEGARQAAERLLERVRALRVSFEGVVLQVTASIGVMTAQPGERDPGALLHRADRALYLAKQAGRDRVLAEER